MIIYLDKTRRNTNEKSQEFKVKMHFTIERGESLFYLGFQELATSIKYKR